MKTIMDVNRIPKKSWFSYRDALTPLAVSLRCDRTAGIAGERIEVEPWVINDLVEAPQNCRLEYELSCEGSSLHRGSAAARIGS